MSNQLKSRAARLGGGALAFFLEGGAALHVCDGRAAQHVCEGVGDFCGGKGGSMSGCPRVVNKKRHRKPTECQRIQTLETSYVA